MHHQRRELLRLRRCPECDYDVTGLPADHRCPECGSEYEHSMIFVEGVARGDTRMKRDATSVAVLLILLLVLSSRIWPGTASYIGVAITLIALSVFVAVRSRHVLRRAGGNVQLLLTARGVQLREQRGLLAGATSFTAWRRVPWKHLSSVRIRPHRRWLRPRRRLSQVTAWRLGLGLRFWQRMTSYMRYQPMIIRTDARRAAALRSEMRRRIAAAR